MALLNTGTLFKARRHEPEPTLALIADSDHSTENYDFPTDAGLATIMRRWVLREIPIELGRKERTTSAGADRVGEKS